MLPNLMRRSVLAIVIVLGIASAAVAQSAAAAGRPREGIAVHGHWVIEVRNPDGSLVSHIEFENDLTTHLNAGHSALAGILGRRLSVGQWWIRLVGGPGVGDQVGPCTNSAGASSYCDIVEPTSTMPVDSKTFKNLTLTVPLTNLFRTFETGTLELNGFVTATSTQGFAGVTTLIGLCDASTLPANCAPAPGAGDLRSFTRADLQTPVTAQVGQIIQVKVILSFS